jgi:hypothetical protein
MHCAAWPAAGRAIGREDLFCVTHGLERAFCCPASSLIFAYGIFVRRARPSPCRLCGSVSSASTSRLFQTRGKVAQRRRILTLTTDFPRLWQAPGTPLPVGALRKIRPEVVAEVDDLLDDYAEEQIARMLTERGLRSGTGKPVNP